MLIVAASCQIASILSSVKVDVMILGEMLEMVYEDLERQGEMMTFERLPCSQDSPDNAVQFILPLVTCCQAGES